MMKMILTSHQKQALKIQHDKTRDGRVRDRIKSVIHASNGWSAEEIAEALLIHETTVRQHIKDYLHSKKLKPENGGSKSQLSTDQTQQLVEHLAQVTYFHTHQICSYIKQAYAIVYSVPGLNKWLHKNGFSYKHPKGVPHKFDTEKQNAFIAKYEEVKAELTGDDVLLFMDAVHPTQATKISCGWIQTGVDKTIETTGSRTRLNIVGAVRLGHLSDTITAQYKTVNGDSIMDFFEQTKAFYADKKKINLVLDGAGYHRSQVVKDKAKELGIILHYLPPYSPNLNPIERLWKVMNEKVRNNRYFATAKEFRRNIDNFFDVILPNIGANLNGRINDNFQRFNQVPSS